MLSAGHHESNSRPAPRARGPPTTKGTTVSYNSITFNADHTVSDTSAQSLTNQALARGQAAPDGARTGVRVNVGAGQTFRMDVSPTGEATPVSEAPSRPA